MNTTDTSNMNTTDTSNWTEIPDLDGRYEIRCINGLVEIRSWHKRGMGTAKREVPVVLKGGSNGFFPLVRADGSRVRWNVARWLLVTFVGEPTFEGAQATHWDGDPYNNNLSNLRWASAKEIAAIRKQTGTDVEGERHPQAKLTDAAVREILVSPLKQTALARKFGVHQNAISRVRTGKTWSHITGIGS